MTAAREGCEERFAAGQGFRGVDEHDCASSWRRCGHEPARGCWTSAAARADTPPRPPASAAARPPSTDRQSLAQATDPNRPTDADADAETS